jgi:hypothetical protein
MTASRNEINGAVAAVLILGAAFFIAIAAWMGYQVGLSHGAARVYGEWTTEIRADTWTTIVHLAYSNDHERLIVYGDGVMAYGRTTANGCDGWLMPGVGAFAHSDPCEHRVVFR